MRGGEVEELSDKSQRRKVGLGSRFGVRRRRLNMVVIGNVEKGEGKAVCCGFRINEG